MQTETSVLDMFDAIAKRRQARREFLRVAGGTAAALGGIALLDACHHDGSYTVDPTTGTQAVTDTITGVANAADRTGRAADDVLTAATALSRQSEELSAEVARFVGEVRAA